MYEVDTNTIIVREIYIYFFRISNEKMMNKDRGELYNQQLNFIYKSKFLITLKAKIELLACLKQKVTSISDHVFDHR